MRFLRENDYTVVSLAKLVENLNSKEMFSPKTVGLTFDDGFQNFYTEAFPILAEHDFTATVFLVTGFCGRANDWAGNPPNLPRSQLLSWREIKELNTHGIEFGAHTKTHPDLTRISIAEARREIIESKIEIANALGCQTKTFAYPYGKYNAAVRCLAARNFQVACSVKLEKISAASDYHALARVDAYYLQNPKVFAALSTKTFDCYLQFRRSLRWFKSAVCGS